MKCNAADGVNEAAKLSMEVYQNSEAGRPSVLMRISESAAGPMQANGINKAYWCASQLPTIS